MSRSLRRAPMAVLALAAVSITILGLAGGAEAAAPVVLPKVHGGTAGAVHLGAASYAVPGGAIFVSPAGNDANAGTSAAPLRTLAAAYRRAPAGGTIVLRAGVYHEQAMLYGKGVTIQNHPGEVVWFDGSSVVSGWVREGNAWRAPWSVRLRNDVPDASATADEAMSVHPEQVFVNGGELRQVASRAAVGPGTFFVDRAAGALVIGDDPAGREVRASDLAYAIYLNRAHGSVVRGIGFRRYATHVYDMGALRVEGERMVVENVYLARNASRGVSVMGVGNVVRQVTSAYNGQLGIHLTRATDTVVSGVWSHHNNTARFGAHYENGGLKATYSVGTIVERSVFDDNIGNGVWFDLGSDRTRIVGNRMYRNTRNGIEFEISSGAVIASNTVANNGEGGVAVIESNDVDVFNNTAVANHRNIDVVENNRSSNVADVVIRNNVIAYGGPRSAELVRVEDVTRQRTAAQLGVTFDHNAYYRPSPSAPARSALLADYPSPIRVLRTFGELQAIGVERNGDWFEGGAGDPFLVNYGAGDLRIRDGVPAGTGGAPLPANVAAALGLPAGSTPRAGAL